MHITAWYSTAQRCTPKCRLSAHIHACCTSAAGLATRGLFGRSAAAPSSGDKATWPPLFLPCRLNKHPQCAPAAEASRGLGAVGPGQCRCPHRCPFKLDSRLGPLVTTSPVAPGCCHCRWHMPTAGISIERHGKFPTFPQAHQRAARPNPAQHNTQHTHPHFWDWGCPGRFSGTARRRVVAWLRCACASDLSAPAQAAQATSASTADY